MKQPSSLLKVVTVASSVLLVGAFVCYRAGAFDWLSRAGEQPIDTGVSSTVEKDTIDERASAREPGPAATEPAPTLMAGSKSFMLTNPPSRTAKRPQTFLPGPKAEEPFAPEGLTPSAILSPDTGIPPSKPAPKP